MKNHQLKELLLRIPPSKETDELKDFLTEMEKEMEAEKMWNRILKRKLQELVDKII